MKSVKRIITVLSAQVNDLVDQMENHEAVAQSTLKRFRKDINEAKFQAKCLERELSDVRTKLSKAEVDEKKWAERAKTYHESDREKAIGCVRRMKQTQGDQKFLKDRELELERILDQLQSELRNVEGRYLQMKQKHRILASREKSAVITGQLHGVDAKLGDDSINDVFERWEDKVTKSEIRGEVSIGYSDNLTSEFEREEEQLDLEAALNDLVKEKN